MAPRWFLNFTAKSFCSYLTLPTEVLLTQGLRVSLSSRGFSVFASVLRDNIMKRYNPAFF
jgi:hypothetical protein